MPTPFPFVANSVLTAAQLNSISELPTRTLTGSGPAVAADSYTRVVLNGTSITYTINTSTFSAGQVVELYNANSTAATIAAGAGVTLNGAAGLTLAQYQTAELYAVSATSFVLWKSAVSVSTPGLVYLTGASFTTATSFSLPNNTFSSTYRNYRILVNVTALTSDADFTMRLRASGTDASGANYNSQMDGIVQQGTASTMTFDAGTSWLFAENDAAAFDCYSLSMDIYNPNVSIRTVANAQMSFVLKNGASSVSRYGGYFHNVVATYDSLSFISSVASSMTGVYRVYGYADS